MTNDFWNTRYVADEYAYGEDPNVFVKAFLDLHEPGKALFPAEGEGRNAVYAAAKGWEVEAFDYSQEAMDKAFKLSKKVDVSLDYKVAGLQSYPFKTDHYNAVFLCYSHFPPKDRKYLHQKSVKALQTGGHIVLEAFSKDQLQYNSGGPKKIEMLYSLEELKSDFEGLEFEWFNKEKILLQEGVYHKGEASVIRLIGRKK